MSSDTPTSPARAIGSLVSGSLVATVVGLAVQPILARLYSPEQFGIADLFVAVVTLLYPIGSLRYEDAIVLPKRDDEASALLWLSAGLSVLSAALLLLLPLTAPLWSGSFADVRPFLWGIAPCFLILRLGRILENAAARHKQFGVLARTSVTRSAVTSAGRLGGGLVAPSAGLLIASFGLGFAATLPSLARALRKSTLLQWPRHMARIGRAARKHRRFALFTTPALLLHSATGRLPILLVGTFALASDVGQLGRTFFAIGAPLSLLTRSVSRVFVVEAAELFRDAPDRLGELVRTYLTRMVWAAAGPSAVVLVLGPDLFAWAFGGEWRPAGVYAQWLTPWMVVMACASALTGLFDVTGKQRSERSLLGRPPRRYCRLAASWRAPGRIGRLERSARRHRRSRRGRMRAAPGSPGRAAWRCTGWAELDACQPRSARHQRGDSSGWVERPRFDAAGRAHPRRTALSRARVDLAGAQDPVAHHFCCRLGRE